MDRGPGLSIEARVRMSPRAVSQSGMSCGRVPLWLPLSICFALALWVHDGLSHEIEASGIEHIDPRASRLNSDAAFCDPRWDDVMRRSLAALPPVSIHDPSAIEHLRRTVAGLPFVARVGEARVLWPDSLAVPLALRTPAACVMQGSEYLPVSEDGVLLPGRWPTPPWIETAPLVHGYLPVIGPNDGAFDAARPGERLREVRHTDALSIAISMRASLSKADFELIGPPLIDASRARLDPVASNGVEIRLEGRRTIVFGRPPTMNAIGDRPIERRWDDVRRALEYLRGLRTVPRPEKAHDWSYLDVRWDTSDITWRDSGPPTEETADDEAHPADHTGHEPTRPENGPPADHPPRKHP